MVEDNYLYFEYPFPSLFELTLLKYRLPCVTQWYKRKFLGHSTHDCKESLSLFRLYFKLGGTGELFQHSGTVNICVDFK